MNCRFAAIILAVLSTFFVSSSSPVAAQDSAGAANVPGTGQPANEAKEIKLPGRYTDWVVAGAGKQLLMNMPGLKQIGVFDIAKATMLGTIPTSGENTLVAATQDKVLVVDVARYTISRWDLATLKEELKVATPVGGPIISIAAGSAGQGPAMLTWAKNAEPHTNAQYAFLDTATLKEISVKWPETWRPFMTFRDQPRVLAASQGKWFTVGTASFQYVVNINGTEVTTSEIGGLVSVPSADGKYFVSRGRILNFERVQAATSVKLGLVVPSVTGQHFLSFTSNGQVPDMFRAPIDDAKLFLFGSPEPLMTLPGVKLPPGPQFQSTYYLPEQNMVFVPELKTVVTANADRDKLTLTTVDLEKLQSNSGTKVLAVTSLPPLKVELGQLFNYKLEITSQSGGVKCTLHKGPKGMSVTPEGNVTWQVPGDWTETENFVIVNVNDASGKEVLHTFTLEVNDLQKAAAKEAEKREWQATMLRIAHLRQMREGEERDRQRGIKEASDPSDTREKVLFPQRTWTDSTGQHKIEAKFAKIIDKKTVVLKNAKDEERLIPLERLSAEDIYHAVQCDLSRTYPELFQARPGMREEQLKFASELHGRIFELISIIEKETPESFIPKIYHPDVAASVLSDSGSIDKLVLIEAVLKLQTGICRPGLDQYSFPATSITIRKHDGKWYLSK